MKHSKNLQRNWTFMNVNIYSSRIPCITTFVALSQCHDLRTLESSSSSFHSTECIEESAERELSAGLVLVPKQLIQML